VQVAPILRIPPRSSCNRIEARRTTRTRRVHPASSWHQSRTGMSQSCAPKHPSNLAHSDGRCASGWAHSRLELERPLPADLCGLRSQQASCSLCYVCRMHVRSWRLLDCSWKAAAGGICVRYDRDRAIPTTTAAQNGLLGHRYGIRHDRCGRSRRGSLPHSAVGCKLCVRACRAHRCRKSGGGGAAAVASRLVGLVGLADVLWRDFQQSPSRRPKQRERLQWPVRVHLV